MEISFGSSNKKKNNTISIDKIHKRKYGTIKYIKPFIVDDIKEIKLENDNMIIEDIEENNEIDRDNKNIFQNLRGYFNSFILQSSININIIYI